MRRINWDEAGYKDWVGLSAAPIFWVASIICFVLGLAFRGDGVYIPGIPFDLSILFSLGLGIANTAVQIVGNDTDRNELGMALLLMWIGSYMLGIGSNVNFLYQKIGLDSAILQFLVCWGLGVMIEVAPERLLVKFLRAIGVLGSPQPQQTNIVNNNQQTRSQIQPNHTQSINTGQSREQRHSQMRHSGNRGQGAVEQTYHPIGYTESQAPSDLPPFLANQSQTRR